MIDKKEVQKQRKREYSRRRWRKINRAWRLLSPQEQWDKMWAYAKKLLEEKK